MKKISIIIPCFNEDSVLPVFYQEVIKVINNMKHEFEIVFVNDGSTDSSLEVMKQICESDGRFRYISFSRNFGKEAAMYAGFCNVTGDYVGVMDADLQDPPELIPQMISILENDEYDCVATRRVDRKGEPPLRSWFARQFYKIMSRISDADIMDGARDYRIMKRSVAEAILSMEEANRFSKGIFGWVGFKTYWIPYENVERAAGETKWNFWKLLKYAYDGVISFSNAPLSFVSWFGIAMTGFAFAMLIFVIVRKLICGDPVAGWASTICVIIFIGGIQLFCLGIIGQYIANVFTEIKHRPHFIVSESNIKDVTKIG